MPFHVVVWLHKYEPFLLEIPQEDSISCLALKAQIEKSPSGLGAHFAASTWFLFLADEEGQKRLGEPKVPPHHRISPIPGSLNVNVWVESGIIESAAPPFERVPKPLPLDPVEVFAGVHGQALDEREQMLLRTHSSLDGTRALMEQGKFQSRHVLETLKVLRNVVSSTTRLRLTVSSDIVLDGPLVGAHGQKGTALYLAIQSGRVLCAKVGGRATIAAEWHVSQTLHTARTVPTVVRALSCEPIPSSSGKEQQLALILPLYALSAHAARNALMPSHPSPLSLRSTCRDTLATRVALCGLAGICAFASAGWAHGDIKPGNIMIPHDGGPCVLIDFGSSKPLGEPLVEFTPQYGLDIPPEASVAYDLACLASTIALMQYDGLPFKVGAASGEELLAALRVQEGGEGGYSTPCPPASLAAKLCVELCVSSSSGSKSIGGGGGGGVDWGELRRVAEEVERYATELGLTVPAVATLWHSSV